MSSAAKWWADGDEVLNSTQKRSAPLDLRDAKIEALRLCPLTRDERGFLEDLYAAESIDSRELAALERIARKYGL